MRARARQLDANIQQAGSEADRIRLQARTQEADAARLRAQQAQQQAMSAEQRAAQQQAQATAAMAQANAAQDRVRALEAQLRELEAPANRTRPAGHSGAMCCLPSTRPSSPPRPARAWTSWPTSSKQFPDRKLLIEGYTDKRG